MARPNETRVKILDAAAECFARKGYFSTSVEEIAADAGVAKGSVYYNFESKEALLYGVIEWGIGIIEGESRRILDDGGQDEDILYRLIRLYADLVLEYPDLAAVIFASHSDFLSGKWRIKTRELTNQALSYVASLLEEGAEGGFLRSMNYPMAAAGLFGMIWNCCDYFLKHEDDMEREDLYGVLYDTFCKGIVIDKDK